MTIILGVIGLVILVGGAEVFVRGASRLAVGLGVSPLVVGLTVVALGTSAPELAVSLQAALTERSDLTVGNVVGSNVFNILVILGLSSAIVPLVVSQRLIRIDVPVMVGISVLALVLGLDGRFGRFEGVLLALGLACYIGFAIFESRQESQVVAKEYDDEFGASKSDRSAMATNLVMIAGGLAMLVLGSRWLVSAAEEVALELGVSEFVVGLTVVATGTSLPEVATSLIAAIKGERDIAVGNVVGSNILNILAVLGISALIAPDGIAVPASAIRFDLPVMVAVAIACLPVFFSGLIQRWEALIFIGFYAAYIAYLLLDSSGHDALGAYSTVMLLFVLPLAGLALLAGFDHHRTVRRRIHPGSGPL